MALHESGCGRAFVRIVEFNRLVRFIKRHIYPLDIILQLSEYYDQGQKRLSNRRIVNHRLER